MSWLFKSLQSDDPGSTSSEHSSGASDSGGVTEELSVLGTTIGRQLRGVAAFLAPPPSPPSSAAASSSAEMQSDSSLQTLVGIRNDLAEIGGSFKSGLSLLSRNKAVTEISRFASNLLQFQDVKDESGGIEDDDEDDDRVPGVTEEVLDFVKEISMRPECWRDFPMSVDSDFRMSDVQREHASAIEHLAPGLAALRVGLHGCMRDEEFWMIYFILLLPRLNDDDLELLSTPKVIETRNALLQKLQKMRNAKVVVDNSNTSDTSQDISKKNEKNADNNPCTAKDITEIENATEALKIEDEESAENWLEEADINTDNSVDAQRKPEHGDDVSFSDLEDEDADNDLLSRLRDRRLALNIRSQSPNENSDWVKLNEISEAKGSLQKAGQARDKESEGESSDWFNVDDFD